ncbi:hypothetical protein [Massilia sp. TWR1-2-2]
MLIPGTSSSAHLRESIKAAELVLSDEVMNRSAGLASQEGDR